MEGHQHVSEQVPAGLRAAIDGLFRRASWYSAGSTLFMGGPRVFSHKFLFEDRPALLIVRGWCVRLEIPHQVFERACLSMRRTDGVSLGGTKSLTFA